jgi:hypothetical protein
MGLKKRLGGFPRRRKATKPAFVELTMPQSAPLEECVIDFECPSGRKMRIQWKADPAAGKPMGGGGRGRKGQFVWWPATILFFWHP